MNFISKVILLLVFLIKISDGAIYHLNDTEYFQLPHLYGLDDYDKCMAYDNTYCLAKFELQEGDKPNLFNILKEYTEVTARHYNYTYIERGICLEATCKRHVLSRNIEDDSDRNSILEECLNETIWNQYGLQAKLSDIYYCTSNNKIPTDVWDWIVAGIIIFMVLINVIGTLYDLYCNNSKQDEKKSAGNEYLLHFSVLRNWKWLMNFQECEDPRMENFKYFHGAKFLGTCFVIWGHVNFIVFGGFLSNPHDIEKRYDSNTFYMITNGTMIVQIFFVMAGTLLVFNMLLHMEKKKITWMDYPKLLLYRICRLTPTYAVVLAFTATWLRHLSSGPLWPVGVTYSVANDCRRYWWSHMLYFNNYISDDKFCMMQSWYLAADTQAFLIGVAAFIATISGGRKVIMGLLLIVSIAVPGLNIFRLGNDALLVVNPQTLRHATRDNYAFHNMHQYGHNNLSCYIIGMICGHLLYNWQKKGVDLSKYKILDLLCWSSVIMIPAIMVTGKIFYTNREETPLWIWIMYIVLHRPLLGLIAAYMTIFGFFNPKSAHSRLFSWNGWIVPSRLSYCVYLIHFNVCHVLTGTTRHLVYANLFDMVLTNLAVLTLAYILALPLYLMVEAPLNGIFRTYKNNNLKEKMEKVN